MIYRKIDWILFRFMSFYGNPILIKTGAFYSPVRHNNKKLPEQFLTVRLMVHDELMQLW